MNTEEKRIPDFILVGAAKAGTTALAHYLDEHPQVYLSPIKEPNYFSKSDIHPEFFRELLKDRLSLFNIENYLAETKLKPRHSAYITNREDYRALFREAGNNKITGEGSVSYLWSPSAAKEIFNSNPDTKIIIVLRNPVERAFSHYLMDLRINFTSLPFRDALEQDLKSEHKSWNASSQYVELGMYAEQVKRYLDLFPALQIKIILHEDLKKSALKTIQDTYTFLGIDKEFVPNLAERHNESFLFRNATINALYRRVRLVQWIKNNVGKSLKRNLRNILSKKGSLPLLQQAEKDLLLPYFRDDILKLQNLINRDLSSWLK
jgi:hypothetical protein